MHYLHLVFYTLMNIFFLAAYFAYSVLVRLELMAEQRYCHPLPLSIYFFNLSVLDMPSWMPTSMPMVNTAIPNTIHSIIPCHLPHWF